MGDGLALCEDGAVAEADVEDDHWRVPWVDVTTARCLASALHLQRRKDSQVSVFASLKEILHMWS